MLDECFVTLNCDGLTGSHAPDAWRELATGRGWAGESELLGCCYELGSPVLTFDTEERPLFPLTRARLDETAELLLERGADPLQVGGQMRVTPLFMASINANERLVRSFLARGADPTLSVPDGNTSFKIMEESLRRGDMMERIVPTLAVLCEAAVERCRQRSDALAETLRDISMQAKADGLGVEGAGTVLQRRRKTPWASLPGLEDTGWEAFVDGRPAAEALHELAALYSPEYLRQGEAATQRAWYRQLVETNDALRLCGEGLLQRCEAWDVVICGLRMLDCLLTKKTAVRFVGLASKPELNGCVGTVSGDRTHRPETSPDSPFVERYPVELPSGKSIKCRAANLRLAV